MIQDDVCDPVLFSIARSRAWRTRLFEAMPITRLTSRAIARASLRHPPPQNDPCFEPRSAAHPCRANQTFDLGALFARRCRVRRGDENRTDFRKMIWIPYRVILPHKI